MRKRASSAKRGKTELREAGCLFEMQGRSLCQGKKLFSHPHSGRAPSKARDYYCFIAWCCGSVLCVLWQRGTTGPTAAFRGLTPDQAGTYQGSHSSLLTTSLNRQMCDTEPALKQYPGDFLKPKFLSLGRCFTTGLRGKSRRIELTWAIHCDSL